MDTVGAAVGVAVGWVAVGLGVALWMARRGHRHPGWVLLAVVLGPFFLPIAAERVEHGLRRAAPGPVWAPRSRTATGPPAADGLRVLVGIDGSAEAEEALDLALRLLGPRCSALLVVEVVPYDVSDDDWRGWMRAASARLAVAAAHARPVAVSCDVLAGPPAGTLRRVALEQDVDVVVVGRRGTGLTKRLLGSVCADLTRQCPVPLLVPGAPPETASQRTLRRVERAGTP